MKDLSSRRSDHERYVISLSVSPKNKIAMDYEARREKMEPLLQRICAALGITESISNLSLQPAPEYTAIFPDTEILAILGTNLERPSLPSGSYMYCAINRTNSVAPFVELTPRSSALNELLIANWDLLPKLPPAGLADFILTMQTVGTTYHEVLPDITELDNETRRKEGFVLNEQSRRLIDNFMATTLNAENGCLTIHALTLHGWMHEKQNLGVTVIRINRSGDLKFGDRQTHCEPVFATIPKIWY